MRYMYAVLVRVGGEAETVYAYPLLGLHTNFKQADAHVDIIVHDRAQRPNFKVYWDLRNEVQVGSHAEVRKTYMEYISTSGRLIKEQVTIDRRTLR
jgi:hypothetical protein